MKMKKIVCFLLALTLVFSVASVAFAAVSYKDGELTVSATIASDDLRAYSVKVDGNDTGRSLTAGNSSVTISKKYDAGTHTVTVENDFAGVIYSGSFTVAGEATEEPTQEPTAEPTAEPVVTEEPTQEPTAEPTTVPEPTGPVSLGSVSYKNGVISFSVSNLTKSAEVWVDGGATSLSITGSGSYTLSMRLKPGTHTLMIYNPTLDVNPSRSFEFNPTTPTVSGSYTEVGKLIVTVGNLNNPSEIWLDGGASNLSVSADGSYVLNVNLTEGSHTLLVYDAINDLKGYGTVVVDHIWQETPAKEATCTEAGNTEGKVCLICGKVEKELKEIPALGHDIVEDAEVPATCTKDGLTKGEHCTRCDDATVKQEVVKALGHKYVVVDRSNGRVTYKCERCGDTFSVQTEEPVKKNIYGSIVKDANAVEVDYTANASKADAKTLVIVADLTSKQNLTSELGLYLDDALIAQLKNEGYTAVNFLNGDASIVIELDKISATWFSTNSAIWCYVFSTDPAAENGTLVKVEAQISGTEKVAADAFEGVTLKKATGDVEVTANGIY